MRSLSPSSRARAGALAVACGLAAGLWLAPRPALGFHDARDFAAPALEGGGAGAYFTGSPRFAAYDCTSCHTDAPGRARLVLSAEPAGLFDTRRYVPGARYLVTVSIEGADAGAGTAVDRNSFAAEVVAADPDPAAAGPAGTLSPTDDRVELVDAGRVAAPSPSFATGRTWTFAWTAPPPGAGTVWLHAAAVDGDGDADRVGDDVATAAVPLTELGGTQRPAATGYRANCGVAPGPLWLLVALADRLRRRRR